MKRWRWAQSIKWKEHVISSALREISDATTFSETVRPYYLETEASHVHSFSPLHPTLRDIGLGDKQMAVLLLKLCVSENLVPSVSRGKERCQQVKILCFHLHKMAVARTASCAPILTAALEELEKLCEYMGVLTTVDAPGSVFAILNLMKEARSGAKQLLRKALSSNNYWAGIEQELR